MCGFIAQLVTGSNPVEALIFFRLLLSGKSHSRDGILSERLSIQLKKVFSRLPRKKRKAGVYKFLRL